MRTMRVLHVISGLDASGGGPAVALAGLAAAQARAGIETSIVAACSGSPATSILESLRRDGVRVSCIGPCRGFLYTHRDLRPRLAQEVAGADVVHVHTMWEDAQHQACRAAQRLNRPYLIRPCGMLDPWSLRHSWWKKRLYLWWRMRRNLQRASAIHCTSQTEADLIELLRLGAPLIVEPNGVDWREFEHLPAAGSFREQHSMLAGRKYITFLGRIHPGKGVEILIPALARLRDKETSLVIVGPDSRGYQAEMQRLAVAENVADRVLFTGILTGSARIAALADADLFALPSQHENFGVAVVEAIAAGTPVVISDQVYIHRDLTAAGVCGVAPLDVAAFAAELDRWLTDAELRRQAAARCRPFAAATYDWLQIARRWRERYARLISHGPSDVSTSASSDAAPQRG